MSVIWWISLCRNDSQYDAFWDANLTINTENPDFTKCFQNTVLTWISCGLLWMTSPCFLYSYSKRRTVKLSCQQRSKKNITKTVAGILLCLVTWVEICISIHHAISGLNPPVAQHLSVVTKFLTMILSVVIMEYGYRKGFHTSGILSLFWFLVTLCSFISLRSTVILVQVDQGQVRDPFSLAVLCIYCILVLFQFFLSLFSDFMVKADDDQSLYMQNGENIPLISFEDDDKINMQEDSPEETASFLSQITMSWLTRFIIRGYRKPVAEKDLYRLPQREICDVMFTHFQRMWSKRMKGSSQKHQTRSLHYVLLEMSWKEYILIYITRLLYIGAAMLSPIMLRYLMKFFNEKEANTWKGVVLSLCNLVLGTIQLLCFASYEYTGESLGIRYRTLLTSAVYRKALRLSSFTRQSTTVGQIINLMSIDANKLVEFPVYLEMIWSVYLTALLALIFSSLILGFVAGLVGLLIVILIISFNGFVLGRQIANIQVKQMVNKDNRIRVIADILSGIKVLKLYAWEPFFKSKVEKIRKSEISTIRTIANLATLSSTSSNMLHYIVSLAMSITYTLTSSDHVLTAENTFAVLSFLGVMMYPAMLLPEAISKIAQGVISMERIGHFLTLDELSETIQRRQMQESNDSAVTITDAVLSWDPDAEAILKNISFSVNRGKLVAVVGQVGAGKSSLLSAMCGEMYKLHGHINVSGRVAYVSQQAWIQNLSLRDNILFGKSFHRERYDKVLDACALLPDLQILPAGDVTEIGGQGINLSGGQKQRLSLARAVYADRDIYLLDDPLSAVDVHVGQHLFKRVIGRKGLLRDKTRILATHNVNILHKVDLIVVLKEGYVSEVGTYDELLSKDGAFAEFLRNYLMEEHGNESTDTDVLSDINEKLHKLPGSSSDGGTILDSNFRKRKKEMASEAKKRHTSKFHSQPERSRLILEEEAEVGRISFSVLKTYISSSGRVLFPLTMICFVLFVVSIVCTDLWLSTWNNGSHGNSTQTKQLGIYGVLVTCQVITWSLTAWAIGEGAVVAGKNLHSQLLDRILKAPMSFFDTTPGGRLLNRFGSDMDTLDSNIRARIVAWMISTAVILAAFIETALSMPIFLVLSLLLLGLYNLCLRMYSVTANQLTRLELISKSPLFAFLDESMVGVPSIRAYKCQERFTHKVNHLIDKTTQSRYHLLIAQRWISIWMQFLAVLFAFGASMFAVLQKKKYGGSLAGMSIAKSLEMTRMMLSNTYCTGVLEYYTVSAERINEYAGVDIEAPWIVETNRPPRDWPKEGSIEFRNYKMRYRKGLELVLKGLSLKVHGGEKLGIVGRTGAGKSSLALSLFRMIEPVEGSISIDGQDIASLGLHDLRGKLGIIPQDPVLFSGTIRMNIDPYEMHSDEELWDTLLVANLHDHVTALPGGLQYDCGEGGEILSVGQRQLICLARALLRKPRILVLDEATAAVDLETDDIIQTTIRTQFKRCTIFTIAHRVNTILDYDRICVLDNGRVKEIGSPAELLNHKKSTFYSMAKDAGLV